MQLAEANQFKSLEGGLDTAVCTAVCLTRYFLNGDNFK